ERLSRPERDRRRREGDAREREDRRRLYLLSWRQIAAADAAVDHRRALQSVRIDAQDRVISGIRISIPGLWVLRFAADKIRHVESEDRRSIVTGVVVIV